MSNLTKNDQEVKIDELLSDLSINHIKNSLVQTYLGERGVGLKLHDTRTKS